METMRLFEAKRFFQKRIATLENDARRAFYPVEGTDPSPVPILMYSLATVEFLSGLWAGWHDRSRRPSSDPRTHLRRMADFLETYLLYPQRESQLVTAMWRSNLVQDVESGTLIEGNSRYSWRVSARSDRHWALENTGQESFMLHVGVFNLIEDLKDGLFGPSGWLEDLRIDHRIQANWKAAVAEVQNQSFRLES